MRNLILACLLLFSSFTFGQTRKVGADTLLLALKSITNYTGEVVDNNIPEYCVTVDASESIDQYAPELEYTWVFDGLRKRKGIKVEHCFTRPGFHQAAINTYDPSIGQLVESDTTIVLNVPPALRFDKSGFFKILNTVSFKTKGYKAGEGNFLLWSFGDGNYTTGHAVKNVYYEQGDFEVMVYEMKYEGDSIRVIKAIKDTLTISNNR
ncbi:hypothetical protein [Acidiluteibacter ferrifornacis]|uniref:PKD domain-containing protein n=1 Tax=Acidiluteibacter ferrifornacis TaxID=2692424 RepID=A0A6N9NNZ2_9FLAO|nr:hypothetical protein [Acidiluteibacter ferrifornacis]MBR9831171.1 hypothetical protein [bacterium]NBG66990.1 hypothetical protein [Acidiluteibacter ferrifornacis]